MRWRRRLNLPLPCNPLFATKHFIKEVRTASAIRTWYVTKEPSPCINYDNDGAIRTAEAKGEAKGRAKERLANAKALLGNGVPLEVIVNSLHITDDEAAMLRS
jgi:hypothetical protein